VNINAFNPMRLLTSLVEACGKRTEKLFDVDMIDVKSILARHALICPGI
jgi:hypothetical protein